MHRRGQALVEFAIILPLLLLLILGTFQVGIGLVVRYELGHAASEAAIVGASDGTCVAALAALVEVYGRAPDESGCTRDASLVEVSAGVELPMLLPVGDGWFIRVAARAGIRR